MTARHSGVVRVIRPDPGATVPPVPGERPELGEIEVGQVLIEEGFGLLVRGHFRHRISGHGVAPLASRLSNVPPYMRGHKTETSRAMAAARERKDGRKSSQT